MRRLLAIAMALCLLPLGTTTVLGASTLVDCRNGADLQAAIDGASPGDTLRLKGTCRGNFIIMGKDLTLKGSPKATLHAGGRNAALRVNHDDVTRYNLGGTVTLRGLTITGSGGDAYWADGVHAWSAEVILRDCTVKGNKGSGIGGDGVTFRLKASTVRDNAKSGVGAAGDGMNVYLDDSRISGNGGNGVEAIDLFMKRSIITNNGGNGVSMTTQGHVEAEDSRFLNNGGRGISSQGMNLSRVIVSGNDAGGIVGGFDNFLWVTIDQSTIRNNQVSGDGGGLVCYGGCRVTDSRIVGNSATGNGGGVYLDSIYAGGDADLAVRDSVIANNRAGGSGGGIYNNTSSDVVLNGAVLRNNRPNDCTGC